MEHSSISAFDAIKLQARYELERNKRLATNLPGLDQYMSVDKDDPFSGKFFSDPYIENPISREALDDKSNVIIVGGGFGGQLAAVRLLEQGVTDIKIIEKGADFGGTW